jgi:hypothetical protein
VIVGARTGKSDSIILLNFENVEEGVQKARLIFCLVKD